MDGPQAESRLHRFFVDPGCVRGGAVRLDGPTSRQITRVLRLRPGQAVIVLDDAGWEYRVELTAVRASGVEGRVVGRSRAAGEPQVKITLYQALLRAHRFELALQKCTELGVHRFAPMSCERSVAAVREPGRVRTKLERWRRIIREAAEQSERGRLPILDPPTTFGDACDGVGGPALILWEQETARSLKAGLQELQEAHGSVASLALFVGPEGGWSEAEAAAAASKGVLPVTLGPRVLRAETAGMAALAAVMYHLGELGGGSSV